MTKGKIETLSDYECSADKQFCFGLYKEFEGLNSFKAIFLFPS